MPMHDWTRVERRFVRDFHGRWIYALHDALNSGLLPKGYAALTELPSDPIEPDRVINLPARPEDDPILSCESCPYLSFATPTTRIVDVATGLPDRPILAERRRLVVLHVRSGRTVSILEVVSPENKKKARPGHLVSTLSQRLWQGTHVTLIDPFPPGRRDPHGLHAAVCGTRPARPSPRRPTSR